jgi:protein tyrosine phosphatase (PTP) superfamily phosphohydrolase (DUF442 family)
MPVSICTLVVAVAMLAAGAGVIRATGAGDHGVAATSSADSITNGAAQKLFLGGVDNFGQVNEHLYRGAQPKRSAYAGLKNLGIDTVVKFNSEDAAAEKQLVESLGMRFVSLPWNGEGLPSHDQVATFLTLMHDHPEYHVFVHCRVGADRTGVMVALYRMEFDRWTAARAVSEMYQFHYHHMLLPHLQRYVQAFPSVMANDETFQFADPRLPEKPGLARPLASLGH